MEENTWEWKPTFKQEKFLALPLSVKEGFYAGAVNAGKTDVLIMYPIVHGWHNQPNFKGLFLRRTMPELRNEVIPRARDYFRHFGATFNKTDSIFEFPSGALYFFGHCEHEDDVHKYDSMQPNYAAFDELTSFTEWQYLYITIERIRVPTKYAGVLPAICRSGSNPGNIGHAWVRKRFIDPCKDGGKLIIGKGDLKRVFIPATIEDNPYADAIYKKNLDALPDAERKAKKFGDWSAYEGMVFEEFRDKHYPGEPDNAIHVIPPFDIPDWWPRLVAIDWGFRAMTYVGWLAIAPNKKCYLYREQSFLKTKIEEWAPIVKPYLEREKPEDVVVCRSANQDRGEEHTIQQQISDALGVSVSLSDSRRGSRVSNKMLIHEYLRWRPKKVAIVSTDSYSEEKAASIKRNYGEAAYTNYLDQFIDVIEQEDNLPKFQCFTNCKLLPDALKACAYDKQTPEDVAEFPGDDPYDAFRYLIDRAERFFAQSEDAQKKMEKRQELVNSFERDHDMHSFYMKARKMEANETEQERPTTRYHGARSGFYGSNYRGG